MRAEKSGCSQCTEPRARHQRLLALVLGGLALAITNPTAASPADGWERHQGPVPIELPRDHGAHPAVRTEWWYLTAVTRGDDGQRYGIQITFFRHGIDPSPAAADDSPLRAREAIAAHLAVADIDRGQLRHAERLRRAAVGLAGASTNDLHVWLEDWELAREETGALVANLVDREHDMAVALRFEPRRQLVAHGNGGYSQKGPEPGNASIYLSWTRLAVSGQLQLDGRPVQLDGEGWFDHEWGTSQLGEGIVGWDWFSLRLDDGRDLMVYQLRRNDGTADPFSSGTLVGADGSVRSLEANEVQLEVLETWTSPTTGATYPAGWRLRIPSAAIDIEVHPLLNAAELDTGRSTGTIYWEGPVAASGSSTGSGYVELTGYAGSMENVF